jgi:DNA repair exonuclease SbcCD ATPase subunit
LAAQRDASVADLDKEKDRLRTLAQDALKLIERKNQLITEKSIQEVSLGLLKDTGIKASIIKEYLPILNKMINKYLQEFDFFINFVLDENFDEKLLSRGRDTASYFSLSEGEKKRIDVSILLAFRHLAAMKNSAKINLLVLDELDSGLDHDSRIKLLELIRAMDSNVWMVSHSIQGTELEQQFDNVVHVMKKGDFSEIHVK